MLQHFTVKQFNKLELTTQTFKSDVANRGSQVQRNVQCTLIMKKRTETQTITTTAQLPFYPSKENVNTCAV